jgi:hypothetical protein
MMGSMYIPSAAFVESILYVPERELGVSIRNSINRYYTNEVMKT